MRGFFMRWAVLTFAVFIAANLSFLGISYDSVAALLVAALVLGVINSVVKPVLLLITLPFIFLSFGLLVLVINGFLLYVAAALVEGFHVSGFGSALGGSLVVSIISFLLNTDRNTVIVHREVRENRPPPPGKGPVIDV
jgi:putative membrane protein